MSLFALKPLTFNVGFIGFVGLGAGIPALALVAGYPKSVTDGLGSPYERWMKSPESKLGLYLYTVSDLILTGVCYMACLATSPCSETTALTSVALHQFGYLAASIPAFGVRKEHVPSVIAGAMAGVLAYRST